MDPATFRSELLALAEALEREVPLSQSREMHVRSLANAMRARALASAIPEQESPESASVQLAAS